MQKGIDNTPHHDLFCLGGEREREREKQQFPSRRSNLLHPNSGGFISTH